MATYWENSCSFGLRCVSWYKCLIVSLVFSHLGFWSGNLFLIAPFPDLCLLVPFYLFFHLLIFLIIVLNDVCMRRYKYVICFIFHCFRCDHLVHVFVSCSLCYPKSPFPLEKIYSDVPEESFLKLSLFMW